MPRSRLMTALRLMMVTLAVLIGASVLGLYLLLRASLPQLDGEHAIKGLREVVSIERDGNGMATVHAQDRRDAAMATGFIHAQERFFQMDLLRRNAAGELSYLFGPVALERDREIGLHRFRQRARQRLNDIPANHRALLDAYTQGVNQGVQALAVRPFEYHLLQAGLQPWQAEDTLLVLYSMYLDLQYHDGRRDLSLDLMKRHLPGPLYDFLHPAGSHWDAPIDNSSRNASPLPQIPWPEVQQQTEVSTDGEAADLMPGSNNWAVSGKLTPYNAAMLANDMHLGIRVPNIWYRLQLNWREQDKRHQLTGLSLPGTPWWWWEPIPGWPGALPTATETGAI